jgi:hypothetical protein
MRIPIKYILLLSIALLAVMGCVKDPNINTGIADSRAIRLWGDVGYSPNSLYTQCSTRGNANSTSGIIDAATDTVMTIGMARIDEAHTPSYPAFSTVASRLLPR